MIGAMAEPIDRGPRPTGMLRRILAVAAFATLMAVAAPVTEVLACSCVQMTPEQALMNADAAWVGVVTAADGNDPVRYTFAVEQMVKGELAITVDVVSSRSGASCGMEFALAQRWRIYAKNGQTGLCSGNELLGERVPVPAPAHTTPPTGLYVVAGGLILLAVLSAWALTHRHRSTSVLD
jgi:hypothetical protein